MMNALFIGPNCENVLDIDVARGPVERVEPDVEICAAIDVFTSAAMVTISAALSARNSIGAVQDGAKRPHSRILRAV
ncbi:MAG: hypothetical protein QM673_10775 [Gordonia sp. (in: high G+C Gram-positive bacteria)]